MMTGCDPIVGHWQSVAAVNLDGSVMDYSRTTLDFYSDGTGNQHAKTLIFRNRKFTWRSEGAGFYTLYDLGGPGDVAPAAIDGSKLVTGNGMPGTTLYEKR